MNPSPIRVGVLNNYSLQRVWREARAGDRPDHGLYGINHLEAMGFSIRLAPDCETLPYRWWHPLWRGIERIIPLGDFEQQWWAIRNRAQLDAIFSPCQTQTKLLSYLRVLGLFRVPIVALAHQPLVTPGRLWLLKRYFLRWELRGVDAFPSHSRQVAAEINQLSGRDSQSSFLPWGPDPDYYPPAIYPGEGAVTAGRTGRDFATFGRAAQRAGIKASIYCLRGDPSVNGESAGGGVEVHFMDRESDLSFRVLGPALAAARVVAIPLRVTSTLAGLGSLADALGAGKPVIMSRNPMIDLDIEREGIGFWVEKANVQDWAEKLAWFGAHPDEATAMGRRARRLVDEGAWNSPAFALAIAHLIRQVVSTPSGRSAQPPDSHP